MKKIFEIKKKIYFCINKFQKLKSEIIYEKISLYSYTLYE